MKKLIIPLILLFTITSAFAWWDSNFLKSKNVTFTENSGYNLNDGMVGYYFNHEGYAKVDCGDIRILNDVEQEINYNITECNSSYVYIQHRVNLTASSSIDYTIYFDNSLASTTSVSYKDIYVNSENDIFREENGNVNSWIVRGGKDDSEVTDVNITNVKNDTYSLWINSGTGCDTNDPDYPPYCWGRSIERNSTTDFNVMKPTEISFWFRPTSSVGEIGFMNDYNISVFKISTYVSDLLLCQYSDTQTHFLECLNNVDIGNGNTWYWVQFKNIDWINYEYDLYMDNVFVNTYNFVSNETMISKVFLDQAEQDGSPYNLFVDYGLFTFDISKSLGILEEPPTTTTTTIPTTTTTLVPTTTTTTIPTTTTISTTTPTTTTISTTTTTATPITTTTLSPLRSVLGDIGEGTGNFLEIMRVPLVNIILMLGLVSAILFIIYAIFRGIGESLNRSVKT